MKKDVNNNLSPVFWLKIALFEIAITIIFMCVFSALMYFLELNKNFSPVLATVSVAAGCMAASFFAAKKVGNKGYLTGITVGGVTFVLITLISFIVDSGAITFNTVFHLIIIILSSIIGGILGVNKKGKRYI